MNSKYDNQSTRSRVADAIANSAPHSIQEILSVIWQRRNFAIAGAVLGVVIAVLLTASMTPKYVSKATLLVDLRELEVAKNGLMPTAPATVLETLANSEKSLLYSSRVLDNVVVENDLQDYQEFTGQGALSQLKSSIKGVLGLGQNPADLRAVAAKVLLEKLDVERKKDTVILTVAVSTQDPLLSQSINQSVLKNYFEIREQNARVSADRVVSAMESQLGELVNRVTEAEGAVEEYKIENNILDADGRLNNEQQINTITDQLNSAQLETARLQSRYDQYRKIVKSGSADGGDSGVFQSPVIATLRTRLLEAQDQQSALQVSHGRNHPRMIEINQRIASLKKSIRSETEKDLNAVQQELRRVTELENALELELAGLQQKTGDINQSLVPLRNLERKAEAARSVYVATLTRIREISAQQGIDSSNVRVVSDPSLPLKNERISKGLLVMLGGLFGVSFGAFTGLITQSAGGRLQNQRHLISATGLPVLANFPAGTGPISTPHRQGDIWAGPKLFDLPRNSADSAYSIEALYSRLTDAGPLSADVGPRAKIILFLSVDGTVPTSIYAANVAALAHRDGGRVLLVDGVSRGDSFEPVHILGDEAGDGAETAQESMLTKLVRLKAEFEQPANIGEIGVDCLFAGTDDAPRQRPGEDIISRITGLSMVYDMIIIDGDQLKGQKHLRSFLYLASEIVLVVQQQETTLDALDEAYGLLGKATDNVVGSIFLSSPSGGQEEPQRLNRLNLLLRLLPPVNNRLLHIAERISHEFS
jgi:uncharacterized protein involved in exopolysaccharide biosynthesis/Mrp family chromosome partitioning ATPase